MANIVIKNPVEYIRKEVSKCVYCGFCEYECPTLDILHGRGYGPRGRVRVANLYVNSKIVSKKTLDYVFTCVLCAACVQACPARIDIPGVVIAMRNILNNNSILKQFS
ncbi:MAG: 4Fe-4S dicluster domain-containing protein [Sulfolobales archaeon]